MFFIGVTSVMLSVLPLTFGNKLAWLCLIPRPSELTVPLHGNTLILASLTTTVCWNMFQCCYNPQRRTRGERVLHTFSLCPNPSPPHHLSRIILPMQLRLLGNIRKVGEACCHSSSTCLCLVLSLSRLTGPVIDLILGNNRVNIE